MLYSTHKVCAMALVFVGAIGCAHRKQGQFADVTDRNRGQATTSPPVVVDEPQPPPAPRQITTTTPTHSDISATQTAMTPSAGLSTAPSSASATAPAGAAVSGGHQIIYDIGEHGLLLRRFEQSATVRVSGDVRAGPTYWLSVDRAVQRPDIYNLVMEPGEFLLNTLLLPVRAVLVPPWTPVIYRPVTPEGRTKRLPAPTYQAKKKSWRDVDFSIGQFLPRKWRGEQ